MTNPRTYSILSLGCAKNTVDSESMAQLLGRADFAPAASPEDADVLIVNTCGFIDVARQESIETLQELADQKHPDQLLIAAGCLPQREGRALAEAIPGLDGLITTRRWMDIVDVVQQLQEDRTQPHYHLPETETVGQDERGVLRASRQGASAYLKIADGCRRPCAFCAIPAIKGALVSRPPETIAEEAARLQAMGIQEIILIAQDTTDYGHDLGMQDGLSTLLETIVQAAPEVPWVRIMYAYPGAVTDRLIKVMARHAQILPYLDLPLQHINRDMLTAMRRPANIEWVYRTLEKLRSAMPQIALRTTFIVGYPGEKPVQFAELLNFVQRAQFDRVGVFTYSYEPGTPSAELPGQLPEHVKQARMEELMHIQQNISLARNQSFIGRALDVLIEGHGAIEDEEGNLTGQTLSVGRSYRDAPEIDGMVLVEGALPLGKIVPVRITDAMVHDLVGTPAPE